MAALLALVATIMTSFLPILNKRLLRDSRPARVAWIINAASLPILGAGTLLLTFNPAFTLLLAWPTLGEAPGLRQTIGVAVVLLGAYLLDVEEARTGLLAPLRLLLHQPGTLLAIAASALWGLSPRHFCASRQ